MRIIISNKGKKTLQDIQTDWDNIKDERISVKQKILDKINNKVKKIKLKQREEKSSFNKYINKKNKFPTSENTSPHQTKSSNFLNTQTNFQTTNYINYTNYDSNQQNNNPQSDVDEADSTKVVAEVKVKQKKIQIPKSIQEKYNVEKGMQDDSIIMPSLPMELTSTRKMFNKDGSKKRFINVKEILNEKTIEKLKKQKLDAKRVKELNTVINHNCFRTNYAEKDVLVELNEKLDVDIDLNKINLIKYLHSKNQVSEKFIKQFETFSDEKLNKLNKICQIITYNNDLEKLDKDLIQERLKNNLNKVKQGYKKNIDDMENSIFFSNAILKPYKVKVDKKAIYGDLFRETKKHWEKINAEKFQRRKYRSNLYMANMETNNNWGSGETGKLPYIGGTTFVNMENNMNNMNNTLTPNSRLPFSGNK